MNKLKDAIEELKIIEGYVNTHSGCSPISLTLKSDGFLRIDNGYELISYRFGDRDIFCIANDIMEVLREIEEEQRP